jgi:histidinol-phosphate aminotransferase
MDISSFVRESIKSLQPYLDANESPYETGYNRYPDPHQRELKQAVARLKNIQPEQLFLGNGSDEAIDLIIRAFCEPAKDSILITEPTYGMYAVCAQVNNVKLKRVPLTTAFDLDVEKTESQLTSDVKVIFLCSPNNPTGNLLSKDKITLLLETFKGIVVIDEAYIDFAEEESFLSKLNEYPNLLVLQTFSKAWGLAGLRLGLCAGSPYIISILSKIKYPYNINSVTQELAIKAILKPNANERIKVIVHERYTLKQSLQLLPNVLQVYPSDANFLLVKIKNARAVYESLLKKGIIVRDRSNVLLCTDCLRITIGTPQENVAVLEALKQL